MDVWLYAVQAAALLWLAVEVCRLAKSSTQLRRARREWGIAGKVACPDCGEPAFGEDRGCILRVMCSRCRTYRRYRPVRGGGWIGEDGERLNDLAAAP